MTRPVDAEPSQAEIEAARERLLMTHPSWFKRLSLKTNRSTDEAKYSATTLADVALTAALPLVEARIQAKVADEIEALKAALTYISSPTMGLPPGRDALEFAEDGATDSSARLALLACIRTARMALDKDQS